VQNRIAEISLVGQECPIVLQLRSLIRAEKRQGITGELHFSLVEWEEISNHE
jgi:hypothetical protein